MTTGGAPNPSHQWFVFCATSLASSMSSWIQADGRPDDVCAPLPRTVVVEVHLVLPGRRRRSAHRHPTVISASFWHVFPCSAVGDRRLHGGVGSARR